MKYFSYLVGILVLIHWLFSHQYFSYLVILWILLVLISHFGCCRHCHYVIEAIIALAELGVPAKDIISLFPQVCWLNHDQVL